MNSTLMNPFTDKNMGVRFSEDLKEAKHLAEKISAKEKTPIVLDRHYLQALLLLNRPFSRFDALLKQLHISPKVLLRKLEHSPERHDYGTEEYGVDLLEEAVLLAQAQSNTPLELNQLVLDVEHVMRALAHSHDPLIIQLFQDAAITDERIDQGIPQLDNNVFRPFLFFFRETLEVVVVVLVFLVIIKEGFGELRLIPSESMVPMLQVEDRVLIEKVTHWDIPGVHREYQRGDILVFYPPETILNNDPWSIFLRATGFSGLIFKKDDKIDVAYIKRLIGLPGDEIRVLPNLGVEVNGRLLDEPYQNELPTSCTMMQPTQICDSVIVPPNSYYMMGDNRNHSADSRFWGFASQDRVIGRAVFRVWPLDRFGALEAPGYQTQK
ncbi:MAG: signal peptidase I [Cyanobacteria bacterium]|nr:signal peptidase I [Cyanobacteriota bacterium]